MGFCGHNSGVVRRLANWTKGAGTLAELERIFVLSDDERNAVTRHQGSLPLGITPYYASLMSREDSLEPLRRTHIPVGTEYLKAPGEADDPLVGVAFALATKGRLV